MKLAVSLKTLFELSELEPQFFSLVEMGQHFEVHAYVTSWGGLGPLL